MNYVTYQFYQKGIFFDNGPVGCDFIYMQFVLPTDLTLFLANSLIIFFS